MRLKITNYIHIRNPYLCKKQDCVYTRFPHPFAASHTGHRPAGGGPLGTGVPV